jgi:hypothetical protein
MDSGFRRNDEDVNGRNKSGHDDEEREGAWR